MSVNTDRPYGSYDRTTCRWECVQCGELRTEREMSVILPSPGPDGRCGHWDDRFEEPDWVCTDCLDEAEEDHGHCFAEYCVDCWHVMERDPRASFHYAYGEPCPLAATPAKAAV